MREDGLRVGLTIALTLLLSFGAFLFFPTVNAPPVFGRVAIGLCASEFVAVIVWRAGQAASSRAAGRCRAPRGPRRRSRSRR